MRGVSQDGNFSYLWNMQVFIYEPISNFTLSEFTESIKEVSETEAIELRINSPGGDVFAGFTLASLIQSLPNKVTVHVDGLAGSIASVIALSGDTVLISEQGSFMIHNASIGIGGNKEEMQDRIELLAQIDNSLLSIYKSRSNLSEDVILAMMEKETFINSEEAIRIGFADGLTKQRS